MSDILTQARSELWAGAVADARTYSGLITQAGVASQYSSAQIRNPATSGKVIYIFAAKLYSGSAAAAKGGPHSTALGTDVTAFGNLAPNFGPASIADLNSTTTVTTPILSSTGIMQHILSAAVSSELLEPHGVIMLRPGQGWIWELQTVNIALTVSLTWAELNQ